MRKESLGEMHWKRQAGYLGKEGGPHTLDRGFFKMTMREDKDCVWPSLMTWFRSLAAQQVQHGEIVRWVWEKEW